MNAKRLFYNWLQKKGCFKQFKYNISHLPKSDQVFRFYDPSYFIVGAFDWDGSNEGYNFWSHMDSLWVEFLENKYPNLI